MITFFPGPSQVFADIPSYLQQACTDGILSISHRSETFNKLSENTLQNLRRRLQIPDDYTVFYTGSATEGWEIVSQSLVHSGSTHFYSGSFGEKWFHYAKLIHPLSTGFPFAPDSELIASELLVPANAEMLCLTQNETSNGTQIGPEHLAAIRRSFPDLLIAVDCVSSLNGINLNIADADIWVSSVQKCFGLPAGLGLLICSPKAIDKALTLNDKRYYNSLTLMLENIRKFQTSYTPNVLGIYLLNKVLTALPAIKETDAETTRRAGIYYTLLDKHPVLKPLITNPAVRSQTVIAVKTPPERLNVYKDLAKKQGMLLGSGYGIWKESTFRIANFPAIAEPDFNKLVSFLETLD